MDAFQSDHCKITWWGNHSERRMVCTLTEGDKARVVRMKDCEFEHTRNWREDILDKMHQVQCHQHQTREHSTTQPIGRTFQTINIMTLVKPFLVKDSMTHLFSVFFLCESENSLDTHHWMMKLYPKLYV